MAEALVRSRDDDVQAVARAALARLSTQPCIDAVVMTWVSRRHAVLEALVVGCGWVAERPVDAFVLSALKVGKLDPLARATGEVLATLWKATDDVDPVIARHAKEALGSLQDQGAIDAMCALWARTRAAVLEEAIVCRGHVATGPLAVRVLTALKAGRIELLWHLGAEVVDPLLDALADQDPSIARAAEQALRGLRSAEAQDALCRAAIERDHAAAGDIAVAAGFMPRDQRDRALFLFLTEQWDRYQEFDFDGRIMRLIYQSAGEPLRARIAERELTNVEWLGELPHADLRAHT
ncbi:MAG: hypothetical protein NUV77_16085, partial [Thermoguttaceae bacterium]|nr:hypothetical protein [Thermoguttaceae bacterium]